MTETTRETLPIKPMAGADADSLHEKLQQVLVRNLIVVDSWRLSRPIGRFVGVERDGDELLVTVDFAEPYKKIGGDMIGYGTYATTGEIAVLALVRTPSKPKIGERS